MSEQMKDDLKALFMSALVVVIFLFVVFHLDIVIPILLLFFILKPLIEGACG